MASARLKNVLFCCTGNVFRSMTAEYALRRELQRRGCELSVSSAGTEDLPQEVRPYVQQYLLVHGLDVSAHQRRTLTRELVAEADLVIAMSTEHRAQLWAEFQSQAPLYLELCGYGLQPLPDVDEAVPDYIVNREAAIAHVHATIDRIILAAPRLAERICSRELLNTRARDIA